MGQKTKKVYIYKVEATKVSKTTRTTTITERKTIESFNRFKVRDIMDAKVRSCSGLIAIIIIIINNKQ